MFAVILKMDFSQNIELLMEMYSQNECFTENQNGPYGPQEPFFYEMGLEISDEKKELCTKTENLKGLQKLKNQF